jgi:hypothetical protein
MLLPRHLFFQESNRLHSRKSSISTRAIREAITNPEAELVHLVRQMSSLEVKAGGIIKQQSTTLVAEGLSVAKYSEFTSKREDIINKIRESNKVGNRLSLSEGKMRETE